MKLLSSCKQVAIAVVAASLMVGCAGMEKPTKPAGPSAEVTQAIDAAKAAIAEAGSMDALWRDTESLLAKAEEAAAGGDNEGALKLAKEARDEATVGLNQRYLEKAKMRYADASMAKGLSAAQKQTLTAAAAAIGSAEGRKAYDLMQGL